MQYPVYKMEMNKQDAYKFLESKEASGSTQTGFYWRRCWMNGFIAKTWMCFQVIYHIQISVCAIQEGPGPNPIYPVGMDDLRIVLNTLDPDTMLREGSSRAEIQDAVVGSCVKLSNCIKLDISKKNLKYLSRNALSKLPSLTMLNVSGNPGVRINLSDPGLFPKPLCMLNISNCGLRMANLKAISGCKSLKILSVDGNDLSRIERGCTGYSSYQTIDFLMEIESQLTVLEISSCQIGVNCLNGIAKCRKLVALVAKDNDFSCIPCSFDFSMMRDLKLLNLSGCKLTILPGSIGYLQNLKELILSNNGLITISERIGNLQKLKYLDLSGNRLAFIPGTIKNLRKSLEFIDITNNNLIRYGDPTDCLGIEQLVDIFDHELRYDRILTRFITISDVYDKFMKAPIYWNFGKLKASKTAPIPHISITMDETLNGFVNNIVCNEKEIIFDFICILHNNQNVHALNYWKYELRDEIGFDFDFNSEWGIIDQDPFDGLAGRALLAFYSNFTPEHIINVLTIRINDIENHLYMSELMGMIDHDSSLTSEVKKSMLIGNPEQSMFAGVTKVAINYYLLKQGWLVDNQEKQPG